MIIAQEKRKQNIVEYILYMFQVEDTIRACRFNMEMLEEKVISQYKVSPGKVQEIRNWYANIMVMMHEDEVQQVGHISVINSLITELNDLHVKLLKGSPESNYIVHYKLAEPNIIGFEKKLGRKSVNQVDTCLNALYALLLLKIQKKAISAETLDAMQTFSKLLALLASAYKKIEIDQSDRII